MKFYDLNVRGQNFHNDLKLINESSKLGWNYINLNYSHDYFQKALEYKDDLANKSNIEVSMGINIVNAKNPNEVRKISNKYRSKTNYLSCLGGDLKINRGICENVKIDTLSRPYYKRHDSGMNHVLAKLATKNNVAIELCFRDILNQHLKYRANVIASFKEILMFHRKYKFPLILTTDSKSIYDIRSTRDIVAVFKAIGFTNEEIYNGFSYYPQKIIQFNKERKNMIVKGVKVIEGASDFTEVYQKEPKVDYNNLFVDNITIEESESDFYQKESYNDSNDLEEVNNGLEEIYDDSIDLEEVNDASSINLEGLSKEGDYNE